MLLRPFSPKYGKRLSREQGTSQHDGLSFQKTVVEEQPGMRSN